MKLTHYHGVSMRIGRKEILYQGELLDLKWSDLALEKRRLQSPYKMNRKSNELVFELRNLRFAS